MVDSSRMPRRILHTSDLHLATLGDRACYSLEVLVAKGITLDYIPETYASEGILVGLENRGVAG